MQDKSRLNHACSNARTCPASSQSDIDAVGRDGLISTVGFGAGAALVVAGVTLWLLEHRAAPADAATPSTASRASEGATLRIGPGGLAGSF